MRFSLIILFFVFTCQFSLAQNFFRSYGNTDDEVGKSVIEMQDSSFLVFGTSSSFMNGTANFYLMNIDSLGNFKWSKTYGGNNIEQGHDICYKSNRNYLLSGYSNSYGNGYEVLAIEVDSVGNEIWSKTYGGSDWDFSYSNLSFPNGDVLITGSTYSFGNGDSDGFLLMINNVGDSLWWKNYGTMTENILRQTILTSHNELLSIGSTTSSTGDKDFYLVKCDLNGDTIWTKTYGSTLDDEGFSLIQSINGNYILAGYTEGFTAVGQDGYYFEVDTSGSLIWSQVNPGPGNGDEIFNAIKLKPNEYRFYAAWETTTYGNGGYDGVINTLFTNGGWNSTTRTYGTINNEKLYDIIFTSHKRVLAVGYTDFPYLNQNVWVIMSDTLLPNQPSSSLIDYIDVTSVLEQNANQNLVVYPNPTRDFLKIDADLSIQKISITDVNGRIIYFTNENKQELFVGNYPEGMYFLSIEFSDGEMATAKFIITKR